MVCLVCGDELPTKWEVSSWHYQVYHPETNPFGGELEARKNHKEEIVARVEKRLAQHLI